MLLKRRSAIFVVMYQDSLSTVPTRRLLEIIIRVQIVADQSHGEVKSKSFQVAVCRDHGRCQDCDTSRKDSLLHSCKPHIVLRISKIHQRKSQRCIGLEPSSNDMESTSFHPLNPNFEQRSFVQKRSGGRLAG